MTDYTAEDAKKDVKVVRMNFPQHASELAVNRLIIWLTERELMLDEQAAIVHQNTKNI